MAVTCQESSQDIPQKADRLKGIKLHRAPYKRVTFYGNVKNLIMWNRRSTFDASSSDSLTDREGNDDGGIIGIWMIVWAFLREMLENDGMQELSSMPRSARTSPLEFSLPLFILQVAIVVTTTCFLVLLLKPFRQPRVIAEILVCPRATDTSAQFVAH
uniref:Uncharacterized protein n=1 Tax=Oryza brachyantha TaxID=4533 RepID=J3L2E5_ORYBR